MHTYEYVRTIRVYLRVRTVIDRTRNHVRRYVRTYTYSYSYSYNELVSFFALSVEPSAYDSDVGRRRLFHLGKVRA